jgi:hypothetical protein
MRSPASAKRRLSACPTRCSAAPSRRSSH